MRDANSPRYAYRDRPTGRMRGRHFGHPGAEDVFLAYLLLAAVISIVAPPGLAHSGSSSDDSSSNPPSGRAQNVWGLPELIHIDWKRIADLPVGVEDNAGGFIDNDTLVTGFGMGCPSPLPGAATGCFLGRADCSDPHNQSCWSRPGALLHPGTYHGDPHHIAWFSRVYALNVSASADARWLELPLPPLSPRQGAAGAADKKTNSVFFAGGWSEWAPYPCAHADAARLQRTSAGEWVWTKLPDLPHPVVFGGMTVASDGRVFVFGDDTYSIPKTPPIPSCGRSPAALFELNPDDQDAGWVSHSFPGSSGGSAFATSGQQLFLMPGDSGNGKRAGTWRFDLSTRAWRELPGSPVAQINGFVNANNAIFNGRYMILIGGCEIWNWKKDAAPKGRERCHTGGPGWGTCGCPCLASASNETTVTNVSAIEPGTCGVPLNDSSLPMTYGNGVFVFDTYTEVFGTATVSAVEDPALMPSARCGPFPFNVANPMVAVSGNRVAVVGGEINTRRIGETVRC